MTSGQLLGEYFSARLLRLNIQSCYCTVVSQFTRWRNVLPAEITPHMVLERHHYLLSVRCIKPVSWNHYMCHIQALYNFAIEQGLLKQLVNPFQKTSPRESRKKKKTLTRKQILASHKVLNQFTEQEKMQRGYHLPSYPAWFWLTVVGTFSYTAVRLNQLIYSRVRNIDPVHDTLFVQIEGSKSHDERIVPIVSRLRPYLEHLLGEAETKRVRADDQLFDINHFSRRTLRQGKPMTENQVSYFFARLSDAYHNRFPSHRYRHAVATELMQKPEQNLYVMQKLLRHRDAKATLSYTEHNVEMSGSCVERD